MKFHAPTGQFVIHAENVKLTAMHLRWALKNVREGAKLPLDRYTRPEGPLKSADYAQMAIIEAAESIGIDLGVPRTRYYDLDLRDAG